LEHAPGTVATLRQTIGSGNAHRAAKIAATPLSPSTPQSLSVTKFHVRVAHAYYSASTPPKAEWAVFTDGWFVGIHNNKPITSDQLKETFRAQGQAQYIDFLARRQGSWTLMDTVSQPFGPKNPATVRGVQPAGPLDASVGRILRGAVIPSTADTSSSLGRICLPGSHT
jgi:hypothetical protein